MVILFGYEVLGGIAIEVLSLSYRFDVESLDCEGFFFFFFCYTNQRVTQREQIIHKEY